VGQKASQRGWLTRGWWTDLKVRNLPSDLKIDGVHATDKPMQIALRSATTEDFEYCKHLYFAGMKRIIEELHLDMNAQTASLQESWIPKQVRD
jgi:hypothetical protein